MHVWNEHLSWTYLNTIFVTNPIDVLVDSHAGKLCEITQMHNETMVLAISNVPFSEWMRRKGPE